MSRNSHKLRPNLMVRATCSAWIVRVPDLTTIDLSQEHHSMSSSLGTLITRNMANRMDHIACHTTMATPGSNSSPSTDTMTRIEVAGTMICGKKRPVDPVKTLRKGKIFQLQTASYLVG